MNEEIHQWGMKTIFRKKGSEINSNPIIPIYFNSKNYFFFVNPPSNKHLIPLYAPQPPISFIVSLLAEN